MPATTLGHETKDTDLRLVKQLVPFILNVSHYMTDLVYTLYYLRNGHEKKEEKEEEEEVMNKLGELQDELCRETLRLRRNFGSLLERISLDPVDEVRDKHQRDEGQSVNDNDSDKDSGEVAKNKRSGEVAVQSIAETIKYFKGLVNDRVISLTYKVNQSILGVIDSDKDNDNDTETTDKKGLRPLATQLDNCMVGFTNLCNFVNQIPVRDATNTPTDGNHMQSILDVFQNELLSTWKVQLDLLNCKVFDLISGNPRIIKLFRESTGSKEEEEEEGEEESTDTTSNRPHHVEGEDFIKLVNWLKDEQVFGKFSV